MKKRRSVKDSSNDSSVPNRTRHSALGTRYFQKRRFWLWLIATIGVIVPKRLRTSWRQEWEAELRYREMLLAEWETLNWRNKLELFWHSLGAFRDALWLQTYRWEDEMVQDLRYGVRMLLKNKSFTLVSMLTLALGIGANTAIFSVIDAMALRPLPYAEPERLFWVEEVTKTHPGNPVFGPHYLNWQEQSQTLAGIAGYKSTYRTLTGTGEAERLNCADIAANFFPLLGVQPQLGRNFLAAEDRAGGERVVILSHGLWQRRFGGDAGVIGRTITLNDDVCTVIGILPADFRYFQPIEIWAPLALDPQQERGNQMVSMLEAVARLKPGVTTEQARAEMETINSRYEAEKPKGMPPMGGQILLTRLQDQLLGNTRRALMVLFGAVGLILLIACANVANLLLARAVTRQKELAIRAALGASRLRLMRQLLTESLLLAVGGAVTGFALAYGLTKFLISLNPAESIGSIARLNEIAINPRAFGFTLLVSLLTALIFGLLPAWQFSRPVVNSALKEGGRSSLQGARARGVLMATEVALAVVLLIGAGLLIRSFIKLVNVDPGYRSEQLLTARLSLSPRYQEKPQRVQFYEQMLARLSALPGVEVIGAISHLPLTSFYLSGWLRVEGRTGAPGQDEPPVPVGSVNPDFFRTMNIPLRSGRLLNDGDTADSLSVVVISESLARRLFPDESPLGRRLFVPGSGAKLTTVIGVVGDIRHQGLDKEIKPAVYLSYRQSPPYQMALAIRSAIDPLSLVGSVRGAVQAIDPSLPLYEVMTMERRLADSVVTRRFNLILLGAFALLALALASVGVYGVISYVVTQRTHEVGIRMALGAEAADVRRLFLKQGMRLVLVGVGAGLVGAFALTRVMTTLLFGVGAADPLTFAGAAMLLILIALAACYLPARRATKVDPVIALRYE